MALEGTQWALNKDPPRASKCCWWQDLGPPPAVTGVSRRPGDQDEAKVQRRGALEETEPMAQQKDPEVCHERGTVWTACGRGPASTGPSRGRSRRLLGPGQLWVAAPRTAPHPAPKPSQGRHSGPAGLRGTPPPPPCGERVGTRGEAPGSFFGL